MQKIMFNDRYGFTRAVLEGRKTMTRRGIKAPRTMEGKDVYGYSVVKYPRTGVPIEVMALDADGAQINNILPKYKVGEVVAVAQKYEDIYHGLSDREASWFLDTLHLRYDDKCARDLPAWRNKEFVQADLMPHQIRITGIRVERLQNISDDDCLKEGVIENTATDMFGGTINGYTIKGVDGGYAFAREAFSALINRIYGRGTWESNPWVFVYTFELVK